jgi:hypothetical protein
MATLMTIALVVRDVRFKTGLFMENTSTYRDTCDRHARVCKDVPAIAPLMVNNQVSGHFGELMAAAVGVRLFGLARLTAGAVQGAIASAARGVGSRRAIGAQDGFGLGRALAAAAIAAAIATRLAAVGAFSARATVGAVATGFGGLAVAASAATVTPVAARAAVGPVAAAVGPPLTPVGLGRWGRGHGWRGSQCWDGRSHRGWCTATEQALEHAEETAASCRRRRLCNPGGCGRRSHWCCRRGSHRRCGPGRHRFVLGRGHGGGLVG